MEPFETIKDQVEPELELRDLVVGLASQPQQVLLDVLRHEGGALVAFRSCSRDC
jgi:hypothetical protein